MQNCVLCSVVRVLLLYLQYFVLILWLLKIKYFLCWEFLIHSTTEINKSRNTDHLSFLQFIAVFPGKNCFLIVPFGKFLINISCNYQNFKIPSLRCIRTCLELYSPKFSVLYMRWIYIPLAQRHLEIFFCLHMTIWWVAIP